MIAEYLTKSEKYGGKKKRFISCMLHCIAFIMSKNLKKKKAKISGDIVHVINLKAYVRHFNLVSYSRVFLIRLIEL